MLLCTVRGCHLALVREGRLLCPRGHSFDVARSGYINLLQPQDRRSKQPGDTPAAIEGRRGTYRQSFAGISKFSLTTSTRGEAASSNSRTPIISLK